MHVRLPYRLNAAIALSALAATSAAAQTPSPAPTVTVTGVAYTQFVYQLKDTAAHTNGFDVTRAYVNVLGKFSGGVSTRVTADVYRQAGDNSLRYRLKYAYVAYTPDGSALTLKLGQLHTPFIDWEEALWDYRMQGTMALDRNGYLTSADFGAGIDGKWNGDKVNMQLTFVNGEGYSGGPGDQRKDVQGRVSFRLMDTDDNSRVGGLRLTGYAGIGKPTTGGTRNRFLGLLSYRSTRVTLAAEFASTKDTVTGTPVPETTGSVLSAFGVYHLTNSKVSVIGRVDVVDPNTTIGNTRQTRIIAGGSYQLSPNLRLLADLDLLSYEGGAPTPALEAVRSQALFQAQFTF